MTQDDAGRDDDDHGGDSRFRPRPVIPYESPAGRAAPRGTLVDAMSFSTATEAAMAQSRLEVEGIPAFLDNENVVQFNWMLSNATGGVRVMVHESDAEEAREILSAPPDVDKIDYRPGGPFRDDAVEEDAGDASRAGSHDEDEDEEGDGYVDEDWRCPRCHRNTVDLVPLNPVWVILALPLLCVPL